MSLQDISCQICCRNMGKLMNPKFPWMHQLDTCDVAVVCYRCEKMHLDSNGDQVEESNEA